MAEGEITTAVSVDYKVNLGNYESASTFVSISGVTKDTTPEEMDEMIEQSKIAFSKIVKRIQTNAAKLREGL